MATVTANMLKKMLSQKYKYVDLTVEAINNVRSQYYDLKPVMDTYVFNDGSCRTMMSLQGTVPATYRGRVYNIPLRLWILDTYPYNPPICFVKPNSTMMIKTGKHIDANGKIYLPYLHEWKHPKMDLYGLIQVLIVTFGEEPPVFARPTAESLLLRTEDTSGQGPASTITIGNQGTVEPEQSKIQQTEFDESKQFCTLSTPETSPEVVISAPEMLTPALASLSFCGSTLPDPEESVLMRQKLQLEIDVLQRQKKVLAIQEEYYSIKLRRLVEDDE
ncbi:hypothetical protein COCON_G00219810 [Conger conger]|uniref:UEV domain-containing protein n=1 Tax=Conger conger TaxID=82655 RepID=A0A9Q1CZA0_CONCO|nr:hypothetical protein COCON_G00219810 [Conger conger]